MHIRLHRFGLGCINWGRVERVRLVLSFRFLILFFRLAFIPS